MFSHVQDLVYFATRTFNGSLKCICNKIVDLKLNATKEILVLIYSISTNPFNLFHLFPKQEWSHYAPAATYKKNHW